MLLFQFINEFIDLIMKGIYMLVLINLNIVNEVEYKQIMQLYLMLIVNQHFKSKEQVKL